MKQNLLRIDDVVERTDLPRSTIYWLIAKRQFPRPVHISPRRARWLKSDLEKWWAKRVEERDAKEVNNNAA